jgi:hypothetical protein
LKEHMLMKLKQLMEHYCKELWTISDQGLKNVSHVPGYRSCLRISGSGTGSTQPREDN